jgi:hypothetical protein
VLRNARWSEQDADMLVPGDIISIKLGDIIPADARLLDGDPLKVDQVSTAKNQEELLFCNIVVQFTLLFNSQLKCYLAVNFDWGVNACG